jgi:hypothetical protein
MRSKWWVPGVALTTLLTLLTACSEEPATAIRDQVVEADPTGGGFHAKRPGPSATATTVPIEREPKPSQGTEDWRVTSPAFGRIWAFASDISAEPGTEVGLHVSTVAGGYRVLAYRIGSYRGGTGTLIWRSEFLNGERQAAPRLEPVETRTVVAPWRRSLTIDTSGWEPGFYVLKLVTGSGWETAVPYIVQSPSAEGTVALVAPVTTYQAYNEWGGHSLYAGPDGDRRSWAVSFDRPFNLATGANDYRTAALPVIVRAEALGIPLSYFANVDLDEDPKVLDGARGYVSMGHDEYWTPTMRRAVERARDAGTNLAFLGANTMYWRIRLDGRLQTGYRSDAALDPARDERPAETTEQFRAAPAPDPEQTVTGMMYECYPVDAPFVVTSPSWWGFRGTGVKTGAAFPGLVGPEADRIYLNARTPRPMEVLSHASYSCRGVPTSAQAVYYTTRSGAGVFNAGTLRWGCALVDRCEHPLGVRTRVFVRQVTDNLLREFAAGPVGRRHPARDTVTRYHLPDLNTVEAS